mmetsp:Transcript_17305/g.34900  ORF Transcript_17305/g.34900 Transcript_17305/m.34900 type:complete len:125 (-) Transcript_17305:120-494(-)|eukprot:CAMPEP_0167781380 /NCGR_PEP_ID=MMETSP0111_2-20121227/5899_1 /TAXON_ID=91324 /ORGANISM="Lotharella globosa, Strain CCCM811" /LENGTH=124 /DNA_ID=CAMNT_0007672033 /DNA_START=22 /DNA_END=396 /DNA_ORIENTATION=+
MADPFVEHAVQASLISFLDKRLLVVLRDGRNIVGTLRTFDQFSNIVLVNASEREVAGNMYHDTKKGGLYLIRGENVVMMGDIDHKVERAEMRKVDKEQLEQQREKMKKEDITDHSKTMAFEEDL